MIFPWVEVYLFNVCTIIKCGIILWVRKPDLLLWAKPGSFPELSQHCPISRKAVLQKMSRQNGIYGDEHSHLHLIILMLEPMKKAKCKCLPFENFFSQCQITLSLNPVSPAGTDKGLFAMNWLFGLSMKHEIWNYWEHFVKWLTVTLSNSILSV